MIKAVLLPTLFIGLISLGMVKYVTDNNNLEYVENTKYQTDNGNNRYSKGTQFYSNSLAKDSKVQQLNIKTAQMQKFNKPIAKPSEITANSKPVKKKQIKKTKPKKQNFKFANKKKVVSNNKKESSSKRKPSHSGMKKEKFSVPENLPNVTEQVFSTYTVVDVNNSSNINYSNGASNAPSPTQNNTVTTTVIDQGDNNAQVESSILTSDAVASINKSISQQLKVYEPLIIERIQKEITTSLENFFDENKDYGISLNEVEKIDFVLSSIPFGVDTFISDGLMFKFPLSGSWNIKVTMNIHYENDMFKTDETVEFNLNRFKLAFPMRFSKTPSGQVSLIQNYAKQLSYDINVNSSSFLITTLASAINAFYPDFLKGKISDFVDQLALDTKPLVNKTLNPIRANIVNQYVEQPPLKLEEIIQNIDKKILNNHIDLKTIHSLKMKNESESTWSESYLNTGLQINGEKDIETSLDNSAYLTGLYLASMANKYRSQSRVEHLASLKKVLAGISDLFKIHKDSGLLARSIMPVDSQLAQDLINSGEQVGDNLILGTLNNTEWLAYQGSNGISLDQYQGILYGLVTTYKLVQDEEVQAEVKRLTKIMANYLISEEFIFEYEKDLIKTPLMKPAKSIWQAANFHKLAFIKAASVMNPGQFDNELQELNAIMGGAWLDIFYQITNPVNNFKNLELSLINMASYFEVESDSKQLEEVKNAVNMIDFYLGHHRNIFIDLIVAKVQPQKIIEKANNIRSGLAHYLKRSHRLVRNTNLDSIETVKIQLASGEEVEITTSPLLPEQMVLDSEFLWQNSAQIKVENELEDNKIETIGLDATLPFWMGMNSGVF